MFFLDCVIMTSTVMELEWEEVERHNYETGEPYAAYILTEGSRATLTNYLNTHQIGDIPQVVDSRRLQICRKAGDRFGSIFYSSFESGTKIFEWIDAYKAKTDGLPVKTYQNRKKRSLQENEVNKKVVELSLQVDKLKEKNAQLKKRLKVSE